MTASNPRPKKATSSPRSRPLAAAAVVLAVACTPAADRSEPPPAADRGRRLAAPEADGDDRDRRLAALERDLPDLLEQTGIPGLAVALVSDGAAAWVRGFGSPSVDSERSVDGDTVFAAASLTKPVVAYAVMQLVDGGQLTLDQPLAAIVACDDDLAGDERAGRITARMVLSHTTGLPNWRPGRWTDDPGELTLQFEPGSRFQYSGEGFICLQKVVEHSTGKRLDEVVDELVFAPLEMSSSSLVWQDRFADIYAEPHREDGTVREDRRPREPLAAGTLLTTASDYARFVAAFLAGEGLTPDTRRAIVEPTSNVAPGVFWGLGWGLEETAVGRRAIWQWGHDPGYRAFVMADLESGDGVVFFSNSDAGMLLLRTLVEGVLGGADHPALAHLPYDSHDSPGRLAALELERTLLEQGVAAGRELYADLRGQYPGAELFGEARLNRLGYDSLGGDHVDEAVAVFELSVAAHPEAFNTHDSLGEAYMRRGDTAAAIASYERSLELNPANGNAVTQLQRLRQ